MRKISNRKIAETIANSPSLEWDGLQEILNEIELETLERNLTNTCFIAGFFNSNRVENTKGISYVLEKQFGLNKMAIDWCLQLVSNFQEYRENIMENYLQSHHDYDSVNLLEFSNGATLPKSIVVRVDRDEQKFGITDINCTIKKRESYTDGIGEIEIIGEVCHRKLKNSSILFIIVYNNENQVIAYDTETSIADKKGTEIIKRRLQFPIDEDISAIYLKPALDPWANG